MSKGPETGGSGRKMPISRAHKRQLKAVRLQKAWKPTKARNQDVFAGGTGGVSRLGMGTPIVCSEHGVSMRDGRRVLTPSRGPNTHDRTRWVDAKARTRDAARQRARKHADTTTM